MERIKINNTIIPNANIQRGSVKIGTNPRECERYTDGAGVEHIIPYAKTKATIQFTLREHSTSEHSTFAAYVANRYNLSVRYWNDNTSTYETGLFHINAFEWSHDNNIENNIDYGATQITLEEY